MLSAGQILCDRYQLQEPLGHNAGRQTWLAVDTKASPPKTVVVKFLMFNPQMQWDELKLFKREAQVLKNLNHPRIPKYLDYFSMDDVEAGLEEYAADNNDKSNVTDLPWFALVQDYIPGASLKQLLDQGKRFSENQVRHFAEDLLKILIELHELSPPVLHRDIKPSNLILGENNQIYLVDFGAVQDKAKAEGVTFTVVGTSGYAPPEQLWGKAVPASDLYALGATLIHLLTGIPPSQLPQQRMRIKFQDKVKINPNFANWIEQLIQPAPERRLSTARQAFYSLQSCFIDHQSKNYGQQAINRSSDTKHGYSHVYFAFLKIRLALLNSFSTMGLCVIGILGIFSIVLIPPLVFNNAGKARESEAKLYISAMNRAQKAYFLEESHFTDNIGELGLGISTETENYTYSMHTTSLSVINYAVSHKSKMKGYVGAVFLGDAVETGEMTTFAILCEAKSPGTHRSPAPIVEDGVIQCAPETVKLKSYREDEKEIFIGEDLTLAYRSANYAKAGKYNQAIDTAETITESWVKTKALEAITTELMAAVGKSNQALPILEKIQAIALNLTDAGESEQALRVTRHITDDSIKSKTIQAIAPYLTTATEYEQAVDVAKTITDYEPKAKALDAIVRRLVATGNPERAVQIAEIIQSYYGSKEKAMAAIARYQNLP
jgi:serine/threonine protein kinase